MLLMRDDALFANGKMWYRNYHSVAIQLYSLRLTHQFSPVTHDFPNISKPIHVHLKHLFCFDQRSTENNEACTFIVLIAIAHTVHLLPVHVYVHQNSFDARDE